MSLAEASKLLNKTITLFDPRSGTHFEAKVTNIKEAWGVMRMQVNHSGTWFVPASSELGTIR